MVYETIEYTVGSLDTTIELLPDADISSKTKLQKSGVLTTLEIFNALKESKTNLIIQLFKLK
jgi:hypothetical protein